MCSVAMGKIVPDEKTNAVRPLIVATEGACDVAVERVRNGNEGCVRCVMLERRHEETKSLMVCNKMSKLQKRIVCFLGRIFGLAAQLGDGSPQPQTIKATQNIVKIHFSP